MPTTAKKPAAAKTPAKPHNKHNRKQSNVRLSDAGRAVLAEAVVWLGVSQASVIELALRELANRYGFSVRQASRPQSVGLLEEAQVGPQAPVRPAGR